MKKIFAGMLVVVTMALFGCGGGDSSGTTTDTTVKKTSSVTGTVSFPSLSALVAKQVAATTTPTGTVIPPILTITDLNGAGTITPVLTVDPLTPHNFTYTVSLDASKNYVFKASWGGQVLRTMADKSMLSASTTMLDITPVSTAAVLLAEKNLNLTSGQLGTTAASSITDAKISVINPAGLLTAVGTPTYATLVTTVTTALSSLKDPSTITDVTTAVSTAPTYTLMSITVTPAIPSIVVGATQQFTATGIYSDASTTNLTTSVIWSSSNLSIAIVASGIATPATAGTTTITATSGTVSGTATLTATVPVTIAPTGFSAAMFSGKTFYDAEGPVLSAPQASSYMRLQFNTDGTLQNSNWATSGVPTLGAVDAGETWQVANGQLQLTVPGRSPSAATLLSDDTVNRYWRVQKSSGITRWYYDQATAQAQAQAFAASGANP